MLTCVARHQIAGYLENKIKDIILNVILQKNVVIFSHN
jgi:hypothetical protein